MNENLFINEIGFSFKLNSRFREITQEERKKFNVSNQLINYLINESQGLEILISFDGFYFENNLEEFYKSCKKYMINSGFQCINEERFISTTGLHKEAYKIFSKIPDGRFQVSYFLRLTDLTSKGYGFGCITANPSKDHDIVEGYIIEMINNWGYEEQPIEENDLKGYMISELLYIAQNSKDEKLRKKASSQSLHRLKYCKCNIEMINTFLARETSILKNSKYSKIRNLNYPIKQGEYGICGYNWWEDGKAIYNGDINKANSVDFTISEIVSITDRAEYLVVYEHENENISNQLFSELFVLSEKSKQTILLNQLIEELLNKGWKEENIDLLLKNEFFVVMKYRYNKPQLNPYGEEDDNSVDSLSIENKNESIEIKEKIGTSIQKQVQFKMFSQDIEGYPTFKFYFPNNLGEYIKTDKTSFELKKGNIQKIRVMISKCKSVEHLEEDARKWIEKNKLENKMEEVLYKKETIHGYPIEVYELKYMDITKKSHKIYKIAFVNGYRITISGWIVEGREQIINTAFEKLEW